MIEGLSHLTFIVKNLEKSKNLFEYLFDAKEIYSSDEKTFSLSKEKFFDIAGFWVVLMEGNPLNDKTYNHTAFKIKESDFDSYLNKIEKLGLEVKKARSRIEGEGKSIYFYDYDNHLFELHTGTKEERLKRYKNY